MKKLKDKKKKNIPTFDFELNVYYFFNFVMIICNLISNNFKKYCKLIWYYTFMYNFWMIKQTNADKAMAIAIKLIYLMKR